MYHSYLSHSSADGHLGCFHVLAILDSAEMNIGVHVSLSILVSSVCMPWWKVKVTQFCLTLCDPMDYTVPKDYTVHGILQARILEWVAFPFSRGSSQARD